MPEQRGIIQVQRRGGGGVVVAFDFVDYVHKMLSASLRNHTANDFSKHVLSVRIFD